MQVSGAPKESVFQHAGVFSELRPEGVLRGTNGSGPVRRSVSHWTVGRVYSWSMQEEGAVLEELMGHLGEDSGSIRADRRLLAERASEDDPAHLRLLARLSEALDATEVASREARRQRGIG